MREYHFDEDEPYVVIEKSEGSTGSFLLGLALGAGVALLFAPRSGEETRRDLNRRAHRVKDAAQGMAEDLTDTVRDRFHEARAQVEERIDSARHAVEVKRQQVTQAVQAGRAAAAQAREDLERRIAETKAAYDAGANVAHTRPRGDAGRSSRAGRSTE
jgi:gas vesicle protein